MRIIDWSSTEKKYYKDDKDHNEEIIDNIDYKKNSNFSGKKYSLIGVFFICGLLIVSLVKNNTRDLQKEISNLKASNRLLQYNFDQALLDNEVITSPENISLLAREYLNTDFKFYKKAQIKNLDENLYENLDKKEEVKNEKKITEVIKTKLQNNIKKKKQDLKKLEAMYKKPDEIPEQIKMQLTERIENKKNTIKTIYSSPMDVITLEKIRKWGAVQVVKVFLGIPIMPGR